MLRLALIIVAVLVGTVSAIAQTAMGPTAANVPYGWTPQQWNTWSSMKLDFNATPPTISSGGCTSPAVTFANGTAAFEVTIGTTCSGVSTVAILLPAAAHGWACDAQDLTHNSVNSVAQSATTPTVATLTSYSRTAGTAVAWSDSDVVIGKCSPF